MSQASVHRFCSKLLVDAALHLESLKLFTCRSLGVAVESSLLHLTLEIGTLRRALLYCCELAEATPADEAWVPAKAAGDPHPTPSYAQAFTHSRIHCYLIGSMVCCTACSNEIISASYPNSALFSAIYSVRSSLGGPVLHMVELTQVEDG